jgi:ketosteroid isomerase-like protein
MIQVNVWSRVCSGLWVLGLLAVAMPATAQDSRYAAEAAQIVKADADFAKAVAGKNREQFLAFIAENTTFNGGTDAELRGRDAVMKDWGEFFEADGPSLTWTPTRGEVVGAGDLGYTTGRSVFRTRGRDGAMVERHGEYLTVWRRQRDGSWKVIFDTGSTLPSSAR